MNKSINFTKCSLEKLIKNRNLYVLKIIDFLITPNQKGSGYFLLIRNTDSLLLHFFGLNYTIIHVNFAKYIIKTNKKVAKSNGNTKPASTLALLAEADALRLPIIPHFCSEAGKSVQRENNGATRSENFQVLVKAPNRILVSSFWAKPVQLQYNQFNPSRGRSNPVSSFYNSPSFLLNILPFFTLKL